MDEFWEYFKYYLFAAAVYGLFLLVYSPNRRWIGDSRDRFDWKFIKRGRTMWARIGRFFLTAALFGLTGILLHMLWSRL